MLRPRDWHALAWLALTGNVLYYALLSAAVQMAGIATASLVIGFLPVAVSVIGSRDRDAVPLRRLTPSLVLCGAGAVCIGWQALGRVDAVDADRHLVGFACAVGALASWAAYAIGNARCLVRLETISAREWNLLCGIVTGAQAVALIPASAILEPFHHAAGAWLRLAEVSTGVAVCASMIGNALWNRMSRILPLTMVGQMILFETMFALLYGLAWERRLPHPLEVASFALVAASVATCVAAHRRPSR